MSEIYGMSETSGPMTWDAWQIRPGTVGRAIPGCEVKIADDGEVICRGGNVFQGYLNQPEKTAETLVDGWLHSGDIGEMDEDGYVTIVDRKKELIITSGGKNISPANLEAALKTIPLVGQAAAIGDDRKFVSAVLVLDPDTAAVWAKQHGLGGLSLAELAAHPDVVAEVQRGVDEVNAQFAQVEQIKRFTLVGEEWLPDSDAAHPHLQAQASGRQRPLRRADRGDVRMTQDAGSDALRPLIGLTGRGRRAGQVVGLPAAWDEVPVEVHFGDYSAKVAEAGGLPVMLTSAAPIDALADRLDGLVLTGGSDVAPQPLRPGGGRRTSGWSSRSGTSSSWPCSTPWRLGAGRCSASAAACR